MLRRREIPISILRRTESKHPYGKKTVSDEWRRNLHRDRRNLAEILSPLLGEPIARFGSSGGVPDPMTT